MNSEAGQLTSPILTFFPPRTIRAWNCWSADQSVQILLIILKPTICRYRYTLLQQGYFCVGLWDAGWGWCEKSPTFLCIGWYKKSHNQVAEKSHKKYHR